jgi:hypothetical protein
MVKKFALILIIFFINLSSCAPKNNAPAQIPEEILQAALTLPKNNETSQGQQPIQNPFSQQLTPEIFQENLNQTQSNFANQNPCLETEAYYDAILDEIKKGNETAINQLSPCFALDRNLILKATLIDAEQFQYANEILQEDELFVKRLLKISPKILQFASPEIRGNEIFMQQASYISRDALKYGAWKLLDNKDFMKKMIEIDSYNYQFASDRIKNIKEYAKIAFTDNGALLEFAPLEIKNNKEIIKIALKSNNDAFQFLLPELQKDKELKELAKHQTSIGNQQDLIDFINQNYIASAKSKNLTYKIANQGKFFAKNQLINRNYITKWQEFIDYSKRDGVHFARQTKLISADKRNYHLSWRKDFKKYPQIIQKIEKFLIKRNIAENILDNLYTTYIWEIQKKPLTVAFNIYLMRESGDEAMGSNFINITSMTAILRQKSKNDWQMTIVEVILDSEIEVSPSFENGHKKYILWDLYEVDKNDKNPKLIFKVEDDLENYFEVFEAQANQKYKKILEVKNQ